MKALEEKFGILPIEDLVQEAIYAAAEDPGMAQEIVKRVNQSFHDRSHKAEEGAGSKEPEGAEEEAA
jgi:hypothetical protein